MTNIIEATFGGATVCRTPPAYQYDYGQLLSFPDLDLPTAFECHFSNTERGTSVTQIGSSNTVTIPDTMFQSGAYIYAWVFLHTGENDGETEYMAVIPILKRARPSDDTPSPVEQSAITQAIAALNAAVEQTGEDVEDASASAAAALASEQAAAASEVNAAASAAAALASEQAAANSASAAAQSEQNAATSEANAGLSASAAETSADRAEQAAAQSGYLWFYIESGKLYMDRTPNTQVDFYMQNGKLYVEERA